MPTDAPKPLMIFLAYANEQEDRSLYLRHLPNEVRRTRKALASAKKDGLCELVDRTNVTAEDIFEVFQDPAYRGRIAVFHFGGHANSYELLLETAEGRSQPIFTAGLASFLGQQRGLQLIFLNACSTQPQVQELLDANVPAVIATSRAIDDGVATDFASHFYTELAGGATIEAAYHKAEAAVKTVKGTSPRALYWSEQTADDRWPWGLYPTPVPVTVANWNLPDAVGNPLFGLPPLPDQDLPEDPYPRYLSRFDREHAEVFFGRGYDIRKLYDRVTQGDASIILFYGQSGIGKSSVLEAGLLPRLEESHAIRYLCRDHERGLLGTLVMAFSPEHSNLPPQAAWQATEKTLARPLILILDQVEEVYTRRQKDLARELQTFLDALEAIFQVRAERPKGKLILSFRKEYLAEVKKQLADSRLYLAELFLEALDRRGVIEAIEGVSCSGKLRERYGLSIEDASRGTPGLAAIIADDLLKDLSSPIAPTLQILLTRMWTEVKGQPHGHRRIDLNLYRRLKIETLDEFLDRQLETIRQVQPEVVDSGLALDVLEFHTTSNNTTEERTEEQISERYAHQQAALPEFIQQLKGLYLLAEPQEQKPDGRRATRLIHDALAPVVRDHFSRSARPGQRARRILEYYALERQVGKNGMVLREADLMTVKRGAAGMRARTDAEEKLVQASQRWRTRQIRRRWAWRGAGLVAVTAATCLYYTGLTLRHGVEMMRCAVGICGVVEPEMVVVPAGEFWMGSNNNDPEAQPNEKPRHKVIFAKPFAIGKYEVTFDEYDQFAYATGRPLPSDQDWGRGRRPVINVPWKAAVAYATWLSKKTHRRYRLPTEAEWEYAARAGTGGSRFYGDNPNEACRYANVADRHFGEQHQSIEIHRCDDGHERTAEVGSFEPNGFGLYDVLGNVWEWTLDCLTDNYNGAPNDGSAWLSSPSEYRVVRGGSRYNEPERVRSAYRGRFTPISRNNNLGFRLAQDLWQPGQSTHLGR